jgi:hypothetical protein
MLLATVPQGLLPHRPLYVRDLDPLRSSGRSGGLQRVQQPASVSARETQQVRLSLGCYLHPECLLSPIKK